MVYTPGDPFKQRLQLPERLRRIQVSRPSFGNDVDVPRSSNTMPMPPEVFPDEAFDPIPPYSLSHFFGYGDAKTTPVNRRGKDGCEKGGVKPPANPEQRQKFLPLAKSIRLGERCSAQTRRPSAAPGRFLLGY